MKSVIAAGLLACCAAAQAQPSQSSAPADAVGGVVQEKTRRQVDRVEYKTESAADRATDRAVDKVLDRALIRVFGS